MKTFSIHRPVQSPLGCGRFAGSAGRSFNPGLRRTALPLSRLHSKKGVLFLYFLFTVSTLVAGFWLGTGPSTTGEAPVFIAEQPSTHQMAPKNDPRIDQSLVQMAKVFIQTSKAAAHVGPN